MTTILAIDSSDVRLHARFWSKVGVREGSGCWPWKGARGANGYGSFYYAGAMISASRVAWELANGRAAGHGFVCHTCDNPICCNPDHIYLGDAKTNGADKKQRHRARTGDQRGESNPLSTLSANDVREIRRLYRETCVSQRDLASRFHVTQPTVQKIVAGKRWGHIQ